MPFDENQFNANCASTTERGARQYGEKRFGAALDALKRHDTINVLARQAGVAGAELLNNIAAAPDGHEALYELGRRVTAAHDNPQADEAWQRMRQAERKEYALSKGRRWDPAWDK